MAQSRIEWTEMTWNPVTGCSEVSPGCRHCYAKKMAHRLQAMGQPKYARGFAVTCHPEELDRPYDWKNPGRVFVNSMSDLFHPEVPEEFIQRIFAVMASTPRHTYQILTKRSERLLEASPRLTWAKNIWMGVSVESERYLSRVDGLRQSGAAVKFLSLEPLLGPLPRLELGGMDWVIVGGESGPGARPLQAEWVYPIRDLCQNLAIPFFFKQGGGPGKIAAANQPAGGREALHGGSGAAQPVLCGRAIARRAQHFCAGAVVAIGATAPSDELYESLS